MALKSLRIKFKINACFGCSNPVKKTTNKQGSVNCNIVTSIFTESPLFLCDQNDGDF